LPFQPWLAHNLGRTMSCIALIESDPEIARIFQNRLEANGYEVQVAVTGEVGLSLASSARPLAVLVGSDLPGLDSTTLIQRIRAATSPSLPIVAFCNNYLPQTIEATMRAGATRCLNKFSCTPDSVAALLSQLAPPPAPAEKPAEPEGDLPAAPSTLAALDFLRRSFPGKAEMELITLRDRYISTDRKAPNDRLSHVLAGMWRPLEGLATASGALSFRSFAQLASALAALVYHLSVERGKAPQSPLRTVAMALDALIAQAPNLRPEDDLCITPPLVLAVDDVAVSREVVKRALALAGLNTITLHSPRLALDVCRQNRFDLILLDILMPELSGFDLCREIRGLAHGREVPIVFVTGIDDFDARAQAKMHGGNDFIAKPFPPAELTVKALLHLNS